MLTFGDVLSNRADLSRRPSSFTEKDAERIMRMSIAELDALDAELDAQWAAMCAKLDLTAE